MISDESKKNLMESDVVLDVTDIRLQNTQKMAAEAEQIGQSIYDQLRNQRERLQQASRNLHQTEADMDDSNQLLRSMIQRYVNGRINICLADFKLLYVGLGQIEPFQLGLSEYWHL